GVVRLRGVSGGVVGRGQHGEGKTRRERWCDAVGVGHEVENGDAASWLERVMEPTEELDVLRAREMVHEVRHQREGAPSPEIDLEGAAWQFLNPLRDTRRAGVLPRRLEHGSPVYRGDPRLGVALRDGNAEEAVPSRDVENVERARTVHLQSPGERDSQRRDQRRHVAGEVDPDEVLW